MEIEIDMKRNAGIAIIFVLVSFAFSACAPAAHSGQTAEDSNLAANDESTENSSAGTPEFWNDLGKTLSELKIASPEGEVMVRLDGFPDHAAVCFGEPGAEYVDYFFGTQAGDAEKAMDACEDQLKCAGFLTTAGILFPAMEDDLSVEDFFSLIGVDEYEYFGEETITGEGWLRFEYNGMEVMVNPNEIAADGGWEFTGAELVKRSAPVSIVDPERSNTNFDFAEAVMFD